MSLDFKKFLEMTHLMPKKNGTPTPFFFDGGYVELVDMKFESYPTNSPEKSLSADSKFYAKLPGQNVFLVFDGHDLYSTHQQPLNSEYVKLRDNWYDYATFLFVDGSVKEPNK